MKKFVLISLLVSIYTLSFSQTTSEKLDQYFEAALKTGTFNGSVLVVQKGDVLIDKGYGYKDGESKTLNDKNTVFQIGSVTKQFTSTVILKLAEQGKLSIKDQLAKYFPGYPNGDKITLEHLLTHTSGIYNFTNDSAFMANSWYAATNQEKLINQFKNKPLDFEPGTQFNYSNSGYILLGYIIEKVTGKKYERVVRDEIFKPLNMSKSGFDFINLASPNKATGYYTLSDGAGTTKAKMVDSSVSFAAGAIYSTTGDLFKWDQAVASHKILNAASLENAFTPRLSKYGFGYIIDSIQGRRLISHNGGVDGFLSHNTIIPADDISVILLTNNMSTKINDVTKAVFSILYNKPYTLPEEKHVLSVDSTVLKKYVGEYALAPTFSITIRVKNNQLTAQATGQSEADIFPQKEDYFFYKIVDAQIEFLKNDKGEIESLILHQSGQHIPGKKVK